MFSVANGNLITVADVDTGTLTVTVAVTNGTFSLSGIAGLTFTTGDGTADATMTFSGTAAAINTALAGASYIPTADYNGSAQLTLTTNDGVAPAVVNTVGITVGAIADIANDAYTFNEDSTAQTLAVLGNDSFENAGHTITAVNGTAITAGGPAVAVTGGSVTLNASGQLIFTPTLNYNGTPSFTYTVTSGGVTETATVNLTISPINDAPVANDDGSFPITGGTPLTINVIANDTDVENDPLTVTHIIDPAAPATPIALTTNVAVTLASGTTVTRLASGQLQVAIPLAATGTETFSYRLSDGSLTDDAVVTLTRNSGNSAPTAVDDTFTGNEDGSITGDVTPGTVGQDSDPDGHTLTIVDVDGNALNGITPVVAPANGTLVLNADGTFTYTPNTNFNGTDSFRYRISDGFGGTAEATVTINVTSINDAPTNTVPGAQTTTEDTARVFSVANGNLITVADVDTGTLTVTVAVTNGTFSLSGIAGLTFTTGDGTADATMTFSGTAAAINTALAGASYIPTADYNGSAQLTSPPTTASRPPVVNTVAITVGAVADIANDSYTFNEDSTAHRRSPSSTNDSFENAGHTITAVNGTAITAGGPAVAVTGGSVTLNASGQLIFTPTLNYNGTPSFTYTVTSGGVTETATVNLTISPINDAPVANDDGSFPITGGTPLTINVIANDTDVENDPLTVTHIIDPAAPATPIALTTNVAVTLASGTTVTRLASGQLQVAIPLAATGTETFSYRLSDGSLTDDAVVTLTRQLRQQRSHRRR